MKRIIVKNLSKKFRLGQKSGQSALARLVSPGLQRVEIKVAENMSFEADQGEIVGIIGRNGSGKSTFLRLIAGIYEQDSGEIKTDGKIIYLNGYGHGLEPRLTMKENIYLMGALMGLSSSEVRARLDDIIDFSGLREFVNAKVYQFSSGMLIRLSFSATIFCVLHHNPEILLLDEVLSGGGDVDFQNKALRKMEEFIRGGATVLVVSHNLETIEKYCDRVLWIDGGKIIKIGKPADVVRSYGEK